MSEGATSDVVWKTLAEIADISTGSSNTDDAVKGGCYPFLFVLSSYLLKTNMSMTKRQLSPQETA